MRETLSSFDWAVISAFLLLVALVGFYASGRPRDARDYFLGGRSIPWWAAALSIVATETSAVTFIGLPAGAFGGDWSFLQFVGGYLLGRVFLAFVFIPAFYRHEYLTVYGFLARRFGEVTRTFAALLFLPGRLIASGVRLFAGCLAVQVATGLPIEWVLVGLGALGTLFTWAGGIRAVVWTDVVLGVALIAGGVVSALFLLGDIPGGLAAVTSAPDFAERVRIVHLGASLGDSTTLLAGLLGGFVLTLATHGTDQDIVQRALTCRDGRAGARSLLASGVLVAPLFALFLAVGTLLHYRHALGEALYPLPENANHVFPLYIVRELPSGISGIVMAGLLAAALSSFTSVLNALASTSIGDFFHRRRRGTDRSARSRATDRQLRASRRATGFWAVALVLAGLLFVGSQENVFRLAIKVFAYVYGALLGPFLLGLLTRRGTDVSVPIGMAASLPPVLLLQLREFLADPTTVPAALGPWIASISAPVRAAILDLVPDLAFPYWIVVSTLISLGVGALRASTIARR